MKEAHDQLLIFMIHTQRLEQIAHRTVAKRGMIDLGEGARRSWENSNDFSEEDALHLPRS